MCALSRAGKVTIQRRYMWGSIRFCYGCCFLGARDFPEGNPAEVVPRDDGPAEAPRGRHPAPLRTGWRASGVNSDSEWSQHGGCPKRPLESSLAVSSTASLDAFYSMTFS